jgi:iron-sulfur cluster assembly accessory protein
MFAQGVRQPDITEVLAPVDIRTRQSDLRPGVLQATHRILRIRLSSPCHSVGVNIGLKWSDIEHEHYSTELFPHLCSPARSRASPGKGTGAMIQITDRAATHIRKMLATRHRSEIGLRLGIKAGGCSGFEYTFGWEAAPRLGDSIFEGADDAKVFVDAKSLRLLEGSVLDYDTSLLSKGFVISNPHATSTCGCGTSFSVDSSIDRPTVNQTMASEEKS